MTRRFLGSVVFVATALGLSACSQFAVHSSYDKAADFSRFSRYAWLPPDQAEPADQNVPDRLIDKQVRAATEQELGAKGFQDVGLGRPDFLLNYRLTTRPEDSVHGDPQHPIWWWGQGDGLYQTSYDRGTLFLGVLDANTKRLVWLGTASARIMPQMTISYDERKDRIYDAVHKMLASFPPK
jgi:hypothetical protein